MESRNCGKRSGNFQYDFSGSVVRLMPGWKGTDNISQCGKSLYPFHDGKYEDFEPIFEQLIKVIYHAWLEKKKF